MFVSTTACRQLVSNPIGQIHDGAFDSLVALTSLFVMVVISWRRVSICIVVPSQIDNDVVEFQSGLFSATQQIKHLYACLAYFGLSINAWIVFAELVIIYPRATVRAISMISLNPIICMLTDPQSISVPSNAAQTQLVSDR